MNETDVLVIMAKNPVKGVVKTRLANTVGEQAALEVYRELLTHTLSIANSLPVLKHLCFSDFIEKEVGLKKAAYYIQNGSDLGKRMSHAVKNAFDEGAKRVVVIGTDCVELSSSVIESAFKSLNTSDVVIGPAMDGGYYLIGQNSFHPTLYEGINWSTKEVLNESLEKINKQSLSHCILETLNDIDTLEDLENNSDFIDRFKHLFHNHDSL